MTNDHPTENSVEMPRPTVAPLVVGLGTSLLLVGLAVGPTISIVGIDPRRRDVGLWVGSLLPGRGHVAETVRAQTQPITARPEAVERRTRNAGLSDAAA